MAGSWQGQGLDKDFRLFGDSAAGTPAYHMYKGCWLHGIHGIRMAGSIQRRHVTRVRYSRMFFGKIVALYERGPPPPLGCGADVAPLGLLLGGAINYFELLSKAGRNFSEAEARFFYAGTAMHLEGAKAVAVEQVLVAPVCSRTGTRCPRLQRRGHEEGRPVGVRGQGAGAHIEIKEGQIVRHVPVTRAANRAIPCTDDERAPTPRSRQDGVAVDRCCLISQPGPRKCACRRRPSPDCMPPPALPRLGSHRQTGHRLSMRSIIWTSCFMEEGVWTTSGACCYTPRKPWRPSSE